MPFTLHTRADLRERLFSLLNTTAADRALIDRGEAENEAVHLYLQAGLWEVARFAGHGNPADVPLPTDDTEEVPLAGYLRPLIVAEAAAMALPECWVLLDTEGRAEVRRNRDEWRERVRGWMSAGVPS